jgi:23S rRNA pseudouridine2604 synthase
LRLNKYISETGLCSRREADARIEAGRVTLNGVVATLGTQVAAGDVVCVDGKPVGGQSATSTSRSTSRSGSLRRSRRTSPAICWKSVKYPQRIFPIGRLDKDSEGLLLLTNNGDIVNEILRSENEHEKEYVVTVDRPVTEIFLNGMASGVRILGTVTKPCKVTRAGPATFRIVLTQGLNRLIRRMCSFFGYKVVKLQRVRIINLTLGSFAAGTVAGARVRGSARSAARQAAVQLLGLRHRHIVELRGSAGRDQPIAASRACRIHDRVAAFERQRPVDVHAQSIVDRLESQCVPRPSCHCE